MLTAIITLQIQKDLSFKSDSVIHGSNWYNTNYSTHWKSFRIIFMKCRQKSTIITNKAKGRLFDTSES